MKITSACENLERKKNIPDSYFLSKTSKIRSVKKLRKKEKLSKIAFKSTPCTVDFPLENNANYIRVHTYSDDYCGGQGFRTRKSIFVRNTDLGNCFPQS